MSGIAKAPTRAAEPVIPPPPPPPRAVLRPEAGAGLMARLLIWGTRNCQ